MLFIWYNTFMEKIVISLLTAVLLLTGCSNSKKLVLETYEMYYQIISENSEYDEAKNDQAFTEGRIVTLENMLKNAVVVDESEIPKDVVSVGSKVKVKDYEFDEEVEYSIVGSAEADPMNFKISNESPVGSALIGKKIGEIVEVQIPDGVNKFEILGISRS